MDYGEQHALLCLQPSHQEGPLQSLLGVPHQPSGALLLSDSGSDSVLHHAHDATPIHSATILGSPSVRDTLYVTASGRKDICVDLNWVGFLSIDTYSVGIDSRGNVYFFDRVCLRFVDRRFVLRRFPPPKWPGCSHLGSVA